MTILDELLSFVQRRGTEAYLVGGFVRDLLLERARYDIDVAVVGEATPLARAFADAIGGAFYVMDAEHDVARVIDARGGARYYVDFARVRGDSIELDLATRDFTINAMAFDLARGPWSDVSSRSATRHARERDDASSEAKLIDPFNGRADLAARRVRTVSAAVFQNDPVRLLRAVRFKAQLDFALDDATAAQARRDAHLLVNAPPERVRDEFYKIIAAPNVVRNLHRLDELGLLQYLLPEVTALKGVTQWEPHIYDVFEHSLQAVGALEETQRAEYQNIAEGALADHLIEHFSQVVSADHPRGVLLRLALLLHDAGKPPARSIEENGRIRFFRHEEVGAALAENALRRLRFSNEEIDLITIIVAHHLRPILLALSASVSDRAVYRYFRATGDAGVDIAVHAWCDQRATYGEAQPFEKQAELQAVIARLLDRYYHAHEVTVAPPVLLDGREVMKALNLTPGPRVGELLDALREAQATGEVSTRELAAGRRFLASFDASSRSLPSANLHDDASFCAF
jgi:tRNA nucleotidyltransferase/poly(A) polymerase